MFSTMSPNSAAYLSALGLIVIQVGIGIILKSSQTNGDYAFSVSGSVTISEFFKCVLSVFFILRECRAKIENARPNHSLLPTSPSSEISDDLSIRSAELHGAGDEKDIELVANAFEVRQGRSMYQMFQMSLNDVSISNRFGFAKLALLYAVINNTIFVAFKLADPGTIAITRSGVIFITACVMVVSLGTKISRAQWLAIVIQLCGLMTTQYRPDTGISYPLFTYAVLMSQVFVSSVAGVYNQALLKSDNASLHAQNAILYACGVVINIIIHFSIRIIKPVEPNFFAGYTTLSAFLVIVSNVFMGIAITAVYKYANAVVKCLASAVATGILLYLSPILFGTAMSPLTIPGGLIVFISSWLYMDNPPPKDPNHDESKDTQAPRRSCCSTSQSSFLRIIVLATAVITTVFIVSILEVADIANPNGEVEHKPGILQSPFKSTIAFVRFNSHKRLDRIPLIDKYKPFFHSMHYSMPNITDDGPDFVNTTRDNWANQLVMYLPVAHTMQHILNQPPGSPESSIKGLIYYHFDAWIDPLDFSDEDFSKLWLARSITDNGEGGGPTFYCMQDRARFAKWAGMHSDKNWHYSILKALTALRKADTDFVFHDREWCTGWSDIYYIPRHLWPDFIYLTAFFGAYNSFHEMAIPTIFQILDRSRRIKPQTSIINWLGDCYGGCCNRGAGPDDVISHRCGHALNYVDKVAVWQPHYQKLDQHSLLLGKPAPRSDWQGVGDPNRDWSTFVKNLPAAAMVVYKSLQGIQPANEYQKKNMPDPMPWNSSGTELTGIMPDMYWYMWRPPRPFNATEQVELENLEIQQEIAKEAADQMEEERHERERLEDLEITEQGLIPQAEKRVVL